MQNSKNTNSCINNLLYTQFNEDFKKEMYFSYDIQYPSFYNLSPTFFFVAPHILTNINSTIKSDVYTFKKGLLEEQEEYNKTAKQNDMPTKNYMAISNYAVTFNKNHVLSTILSLMGFDGSCGPLYDELNNYNIDLLTGNTLTIKDIFNTNVDYIKLVKDYISYKINQNKNFYYKDVVVEIPDDQSFYITNNGIVIYFGLDEIAPSEFGIPRFKMSFSKFAPYINPRFYCFPSNSLNTRNAFFNG